MKITDEMIRSGALVLCPHLDQLPAAMPESQRHWYPEGYSDQAAVLDDARMVLEAGLIAAPPVEYAGLVAQALEITRGCNGHPLSNTAQTRYTPTAGFLRTLADAITALEARAREAERELARINGALAVKGGTEHAPTQDAYSAACRALEKHRERADAAEARIRELEAAVLAEREACAEVADDHGRTWGLAHSTPAIAIAAAIRARTQADAPAPTVLDEIAAERRRQIEVEGWTPEHDDQHEYGELAKAAACYALHSARTDLGRIRNAGSPDYLIWPPSWTDKWWKPKDRRRDLIRAGALIVAEIERLDRTAPAQPVEEAGNG